ncbi:alpha/beta fold hydrolase [Acuticoccus mangrovi]|uniref:Alpha/beta hydrolase n=1 Tax=Acuticoccus mangrovi TaxID=2796142 RepID=A0A934ID67_9HYPH|nr:alpha/beta hydrolase [Acuticoccus mangrovi]MBJ3774364.1 alpha/beta hydrolase [Acuticoccus mangrovi]
MAEPPIETPARSEAGWGRAALIYGGAALVGTALLEAHQRRTAETAFPPVGRFVRMGGSRLHVLDVGSGPPVLLIHGVGSSILDWIASGLIDALTPHARVIAIDRPGYGHSVGSSRVTWTPRRQASLFAALLERLGVPEATVVGHSFGVLPALHMALFRPPAARALVLVGGVFFAGSTVAGAGGLLPSVPGVGRVLRSTVMPSLARAAMPSLIRRMFAPDEPTDAFNALFSPSMASRPSQLHASLRDIAAMEPAVEQLSSRYGELAVPTTLIAGEKDQIFPTASQSARLAGACPHARFVPIAEAGHMVHHTDTARVAAAILDSLGSGVPQAR